mgnify:CR=1 FL=1
MEKLGESLKKLLLIGIGTAAVTAEKSKEILDDLVKKGELTVEQGKVLNKELKHNIKETLKDNVNVSVKASTPEELQTLLEKMTPEQIEQLEEIVLLSEFHLKKDKDKVVQVSDLDGKFHHVLYEASNSRIMEHTLSDFHKYVKMARMLSVGAKNRAEKSIEEHKAILEAIKKGDADEAERLANLHIMHVMENLHIEIED